MRNLINSAVAMMATIFVLGAVSPAMALDEPAWVAYDCPGFLNPQAPFDDFNGDGCFDTLDGDVVVSLNGNLNTTGGLVVPPGSPTQVVAVAPGFYAWVTNGDCRFHDAKIFLADGVSMTVACSNGRGVLENVNLKGDLGSGFALGADQDGYLSGKVNLKTCKECASFSVFALTSQDGGDVLIQDRANIKAGRVALEAGFSPGSCGTIAWGEKVNLTVKNTEGGVEIGNSNCAETDFVAQDGKITSFDTVDIFAPAGVDVDGQLKISANKFADIWVNITSDTGNIDIDQPNVKAGGGISVSTASVAKLGGPTDEEARNSQLFVKDKTPGSGVTVIGMNGVDTFRTKIVGQDNLIQADGFTISTENGKFLGRDSNAVPASETVLDPGPGAACNITGTKVSKTTLDTSACSSLSQ